ncbi:MAG: tetratricopeptide repeat protein [Marinifilaceae bacterium]
MLKEQQQVDNLEQIEGALSRSEQFIEKNQKNLLAALLIIMVAVGGWFGYDKLVREPKVAEAQAQLFGAQTLFENDDYTTALNGDGNRLGFLEVANKYSATPAGNLANYYAGLSYLYLGEYENAIAKLKAFSADDLLMGNMALANIGDAYMQLNNYKEAASFYGKATASKQNDFSTPYILMKQGLALEKAGDAKKAVEVYSKVEKDFPNSMQAREVEKYITRAKLAN